MCAHCFLSHKMHLLRRVGRWDPAGSVVLLCGVPGLDFCATPGLQAWCFAFCFCRFSLMVAHGRWGNPRASGSRRLLCHGKPELWTFTGSSKCQSQILLPDGVFLLQNCYWNVTAVLPKCYGCVTAVLRWCYGGVTAMLRRCLGRVTEQFSGISFSFLPLAHIWSRCFCTFCASLCSGTRIFTIAPRPSPRRKISSSQVFVVGTSGPRAPYERPVSSQ